MTPLAQYLTQSAARRRAERDADVSPVKEGAE